MQRVLVVLVILVGLVVGVWYGVGLLTQHAGVVFDAPTGNDVVAIGEIQTAPTRFIGERVALEGTLHRDNQHGRVLWFLSDRTGSLRIEFRANILHQPEAQGEQQVRVVGYIWQTDTGELVVAYP